MPEEGKNILKCYPWKKSIKAPFALYAGLECLLIKEQSCQKDPEKSYNERKAKHEPSHYSLSLICSFDSTKKRYVHRGRDCVEHFCKKLKEFGTEIINYEKKEMIPLTDEEIKFYENQKQCHICEKGFFKTKKDKFKHIKLRDHCHYTGKFRGAAHSICNLRYKVPKKIPVIIHNRSTYDDHFIIKQLPEEFEGQFECLGENTEKYFFSVLIKKEVAIDENDDDHDVDDDKDDDGKKRKRCTYRISFVDSLCQVNYQTLLIIYQEFMIKNVYIAEKKN